MEESYTLAKAYVQVIPTTQGIKSNISNELGDELSGEGDKSGSKFGSTFASAAKGAAKAATAAVTAIVSAAISEGSKLEQSIGGIETLFGAGGAESVEEYAQSVGKSVNEVRDEYDSLMRAQTEVLSNADNAYQTAGLSANEYMEQCTSFAAALISSLDGDTEAAASAADQAIIDMADNANKMGTSMEDIQNAYQGFAKQNYTMLDNLKLGYGGTKSEMERLLADAEEISGIEYDIDNLADVYEAIHVIQDELNITGTTADEAANTFTGSFSAMKAAAQNLLGDMAIGEDITDDISDLVTTATTFISNNAIPMISNALSGISQCIPAILPQLTSAIIGILPTLLTTILTTVTSLIQAVIDAVPALLEMFQTMLPELLDMLLNLGISVLTGFVEMFPTIIENLVGIVTTLCEWIGENLPEIVASVIELIPLLLTAISEQLPNLLESGGEMLTAILNGIIQCLPTLIAYLPTLINSIINYIATNLSTFIQSGISIVTSLVSGLVQAIPSIIACMPDILASIIDAIVETDWLSLGKDIIQGLINGLGSMASALWDAAKNVASQVLNSIKEALGIGSPSRVFRDEVGKMVDAGFKIGLEADADDVINTMTAISDDVTGAANIDVKTSLSSEYKKVGKYEYSDTKKTGKDEDPDDDTPVTIVIPVYIGQKKIDEIIVNAIKSENYRSGGKAFA